MASIRKRGSKWQAQVRRIGHPPVTRSFQLKDDAARWARACERAFDQGVPQGDTRTTSTATVHALLDRYGAEVTPRKRSSSDYGHLRQIMLSLWNGPISHLTGAHVAAFRDQRSKSVSPATVRKEMYLLTAVLKTAANEWSVDVPADVMSRVRKPAEPTGRQRRPISEELIRLTEVLSLCKSKLALQVFLFALATGMRRGEVLSLKWPNIDQKNRVALLPMTKNGEARRVPLSASAMDVLQERLKATQWTPEGLLGASCELVFPISANAVRLAWERARVKAGIKDLRFHDLRHEAISRFFEMGLSVPEVALISGHKDVRMLFRYTQLRAENVAKKLG